jgi:hypothetical protein
MDRIEELVRRRHSLWSRPWHAWTPDTEARVKYLSKLIEEAYVERRKTEAEERAKFVGSRRRVRRLPPKKADASAKLPSRKPQRPRNVPRNRKVDG